MSFQVHDLTPELRKKLDKFLPIPASNKFDYVPIAFRDLPTDQQPVFHLKSLDGIAQARSMDALWHGSLDSSTFTRGEFIVFTTERGVEGWNNYFDIKYVGKQSMGQLPPGLLSELCDAICERKQLSDEEKLGLK